MPCCASFVKGKASSEGLDEVDDAGDGDEDADDVEQQLHKRAALLVAELDPFGQHEGYTQADDNGYDRCDRHISIDLLLFIDRITVSCLSLP